MYTEAMTQAEKFQLPNALVNLQCQKFLDALAGHRADIPDLGEEPAQKFSKLLTANKDMLTHYVEMPGADGKVIKTHLVKILLEDANVPEAYYVKATAIELKYPVTPPTNFPNYWAFSQLAHHPLVKDQNILNKAAADPVLRMKRGSESVSLGYEMLRCAIDMKDYAFVASMMEKGYPLKHAEKRHDITSILLGKMDIPEVDAKRIEAVLKDLFDNNPLQHAFLQNLTQKDLKFKELYHKNKGLPPVLLRLAEQKAIMQTYEMLMKQPQPGLFGINESIDNLLDTSLHSAVNERLTAAEMLIKFSIQPREYMGTSAEIAQQWGINASSILGHALLQTHASYTDIAKKSNAFEATQIVEKQLNKDIARLEAQTSLRAHQKKKLEEVIFNKYEIRPKEFYEAERHSIAVPPQEPHNMPDNPFNGALRIKLPALGKLPQLISMQEAKDEIICALPAGVLTGLKQRKL